MLTRREHFDMLEAKGRGRHMRFLSDDALAALMELKENGHTIVTNPRTQEIKISFVDVTG